MPYSTTAVLINIIQYYLKLSPPPIQKNTTVLLCHQMVLTGVREVGLSVRDPGAGLSIQRCHSRESVSFHGRFVHFHLPSFLPSYCVLYCVLQKSYCIQQQEYSVKQYDAGGVSDQPFFRPFQLFTNQFQIHNKWDKDHYWKRGRSVSGVGARNPTVFPISILWSCPARVFWRPPIV